MSDDPLATACDTLKAQPKAKFRSETARLGLVISDVERAAEMGISLRAIYDDLVKAGLDIGFEGFRKGRLRLLKKAKSKPAPQAQKATNETGDAGDEKPKRFGKKPKQPKFSHDPTAAGIYDKLNGGA